MLYSFPQIEAIFIVKGGSTSECFAEDLAPILSKLVEFVAHGVVAQEGKKHLGVSKEVFSTLKALLKTGLEETGLETPKLSYGADLCIPIAVNLHKEMEFNPELKKEVTEGKPGLIFANSMIISLLTLQNEFNQHYQSDFERRIINENPAALLTEGIIHPLLHQALLDMEFIKELKDTCSASSFKVRTSGFLRRNKEFTTNFLAEQNKKFRTAGDFYGVICKAPSLRLRDTIDRELAKYGFITKAKNHDLFFGAAGIFFTFEEQERNWSYQLEQIEHLSFAVKCGTDVLELENALEPVLSKLVQFVAQGAAAQTGNKHLGSEKIFERLKEVSEKGLAAAGQKYRPDLYMSIVLNLQKEMESNAELKKEVTEGKPGLIFADRTILNLLELLEDTRFIEIMKLENPAAFLQEETIKLLLQKALSNRVFIDELTSSFKVRTSFVDSLATEDQEPEESKGRR